MSSAETKVEIKKIAGEQVKGFWVPNQNGFYDYVTSPSQAASKSLIEKLLPEAAARIKAEIKASEAVERLHQKTRAIETFSPIRVLPEQQQKVFSFSMPSFAPLLALTISIKNSITCTARPVQAARYGGHMSVIADLCARDCGYVGN